MSVILCLNDSTLLFYKGTHGVAYEEDSTNLSSDVSFEELERGEWNLLYIHPETFESRKFGGLLRSDVYRHGVCAIVIDELHMISEWYFTNLVCFLFAYLLTWLLKCNIFIILHDPLKC